MASEHGCLQCLEGAVRPIMCCCRLQSCCCYPLREGSIAIGIIDLILSAIGAGLQVWAIVAAISSVNGVGVNPVTYVTFGNLGVSGVSMVFSILLIVGAVKNNACMCLPWVIWSSIRLILQMALLAFICLDTFYFSKLVALTAAGVVTAALLRVYITIGILVVIITFLVYGLSVVDSFRQELKESGDDYEYEGGDDYPAGAYPMQAV
ncbi:uncharacterized protein LOC144924865 isoform X1 [Branchiostoma floridae x Branchiostoma belcheri]